MKSQNSYTHRETCMEIRTHVGIVFIGTDSEAYVSGSRLTEFGMCNTIYVLRCISQTMRVHRASVMWMYSIQ